MIHPQAIVDPDASLGEGVEVGPWTWIGPGVVVGDGCRIASHVVLRGPTRLGRNNRIFQFASVGEECQDKKYAGEPTRLEIGDNNVIREGCTLHRGTIQDESVTRIGSDNLLMAYAHVAHDCRVGNGVILANNVALAGHVQVGDQAVLGGFTAVHQFCKIGPHVMCGAGTVVIQDVPAYVMTNGNTAVPRGINVEGLKRRGFSKADIQLLRKAYRFIYRSGLSVDQALDELNSLADESRVLVPLIESLSRSSRGIIR